MSDPLKSRICDRGHIFEAAESAIGVTLLNGVTPADPTGDVTQAGSAIGVTLLSPAEEAKRRICDRGHTFEASPDPRRQLVR